MSARSVTFARSGFDAVLAWSGQWARLCALRRGAQRLVPPWVISKLSCGRMRPSAGAGITQVHAVGLRWCHRGCYPLLRVAFSGSRIGWRRPNYVGQQVCRYVAGDPINFRDPFGLEKTEATVEPGEGDYDKDCSDPEKCLRASTTIVNFDDDEADDPQEPAEGGGGGGGPTPEDPGSSPGNPGGPDGDQGMPGPSGPSGGGADYDQVRFQIDQMSFGDQLGLAFQGVGQVFSGEVGWNQEEFSNRLDGGKKMFEQRGAIGAFTDGLSPPRAPRFGFNLLKKRKRRPWRPPFAVDAKFPGSWGPGKPNKKGQGRRWTDPNNPRGNGVRIDRGDPSSPNPSQRVDHVVVRSNGKVIGRDGAPIQGSIRDNGTAAHIPLSDWMRWSSWSAP